MKQRRSGFGAATRLAPSLALCMLVSCGDDALLMGSPPMNRDPDPTLDAGAAPSPPAIETVVREDFESRLFVDSSSVALLDVNRGIVTLPIRSFPELNTADPSQTVSGDLETNGLIKGTSVSIEREAQVMASDSLEIRAHDTLSIAGRVKAGPGGVTLVAGRALFIDGTIESEGPVRIRAGSPRGRIDIAGRIMTTSLEGEVTSPINIVGRGEITISGVLSTGNAATDSGDVTMFAYQAVTLSGEGTIVRTGDSEGGISGSIDIASEAVVRMEDGASALAGNTLGPGTGGAVMIRGQSVDLTAESVVKSGAAPSGTGGRIDIIAEELLSTKGFVELTSGRGRTGGTIGVAARTATVGFGSILTAGRGDAGGGPGDVELTISGDLVVEERVHMIGGEGVCTNGGDVRIQAAGRLTIDEGAALRGGPAGPSDDGACGARLAAGGNVVIIAQEVVGPVGEAAMAGFGLPEGEVEIKEAPGFLLPRPSTRVRTIGWVTSRIIDRGQASTGLVPELLDFGTETPSGTLAKIQLAAGMRADDPFDTWYDASGEDTDLEALAPFQLFRYRVWLKGRALDTPLVDYFEIDFAPE